MPEIIEEKLSSKILALFENHQELPVTTIISLLFEENEAGIKSALTRLRGSGGPKKLRVKRYLKIMGRAGFEIPVLELGDGPDSVKTVDNIEIDDEAARRAKRVREQREELRFKREMAALDW
jgi:hypothetical protein